MQVQIRGRYMDKFGEFNLPELCHFKETDKDAVLWAVKEVNYLQDVHRFNVLSCEVYEYNPKDGQERIINKIF